MLIHEVRNPLALILVLTRGIATGRTAPGEPQAAALARIDAAVQDISAVLERCVETDQLDRGALPAHPAPDDAAHRLRDWLALHRDRARIQARLPRQLPAHQDMGLWLAMVRNLVDNALKYAPAGAPVQLSLQGQGGQQGQERQEGGRRQPGQALGRGRRSGQAGPANPGGQTTPPGHLLVEVRNPVGPAGRPDPSRLFSKYYRSDQAAGISGTGLGLYWVQQLARRLGGELRYLAPPGADAEAGTSADAPPTVAQRPPADAPVVFQLRLPR